MRRLLILAVGIFLFVPQIALACAGSINWTGNAGDGLWGTKGNWDKNRLPGMNDDVCIGGGFSVSNQDETGVGPINSLALEGSLTLNDTSLTLNSTSATSTINNLTLKGPNLLSILTVNGKAEFTGTLTLSDGAVGGPGTATITGVVTVVKGQNARCFLVTNTVDNKGSISVSEDGVQLTLGISPGTFTNEAGASINLQGDGISITSGTTFNNSGSIAKSKGSGSSTFAQASGQFNHQGTGASVASQSGTLVLNVLGTSTGGFSASSGATLQFAYQMTLNAGTTFGGSGTIDIAFGGLWDVEAPVTVNTTNLTFDGQTGTLIRGNKDLTIKSVTVTWNSGTIGGLATSNIILTKRAKMQIVTTGLHGLQRNLDLFGTVNMSADLELTPSTVTIEGNAKFNILTPNGIHGQGVINNGGIFQKAKVKGGGEGVSTLDYNGTFNIVAPQGAHPAVMVNAGTLNFATLGGSLGGIWTVGSHATLEFSAGKYSLPDGFQISGAGTTLLTFATWSLASGTSGISVDTAVFEFDGTAGGGGIIQGSNNLMLNSTTSTWTGGTMQGPGTTTIPAGVTLTIKNSNPPGNKPLVEGRTIENGGTTEIVDNTSLLLGGGAVWHNQAGSVFEFKKDGNIGDNGGGVTFNNDGTVQKTGGAPLLQSRIQFSGTFNNNKSAKVISVTGRMYLSSSQGTSAGAFIADAADALLVFSGTWTINSGTTMSGNGTISVSSPATWNLTANLDVQAKYFATYGTITGGFDLTLKSGNSYLAGTRKGVIDQHGKPVGTIKVSRGYVEGTLTLDACTLDNSGTLTIRTGPVVVQDSAVLLNEKGGRIVLAVDKKLNTPAVQVNSGTFSNLGTVELETFSWVNTTQTIGGLLPMENQGTISVPNNRTLQLSAGFNDLGGAMTLQGGTILTGDKFNIQGGTFGGSGTASGPINNTGGTVEAGSATPGPSTGILNLNAPLTQGSGGAITALISGTTAGTQYDQINSTSSMALNGSLNLQFGNNFTPAPTDKFNILNFSSSTGNFGTVNAPTGWTAHLNFTGTALNVSFTKNGFSIEPKAARVKVDAMTQFRVGGASARGVTWSVKESGGGTVTRTGLYTAPGTPGTYHVVVASVADKTKSDTATVTVTLADRVVVTPSAAVLRPGQSLRLHANQSVLWSVAEGKAGGSVSAGGSYTAPRQPGLYHVVATSAAENSNHAVVNIAVSGGKLQSAYVAEPGKNAVSVLAGSTGEGLAASSLRETESLAAGQRPVALTLSPNRKLLLSANADSNDVTVFALLHGEGALGGNSFAAGTQPSAAAFDPTGRFVFVTNQGSDDVSVFSVDASGQLTFLRSHAFTAGDKPSAIAVHPGGSLVYVTNAGTNTVQGFAYDALGMLRPLGGSPSATGTGPSAALVDPAGKFLLVANRGSGAISAFAIDLKNETLQEVKGSPFKTGKGAAAIAIDLTGSYLLVADHEANEIASLQIDSETGALTLLGRTPLLSAGPSSLAVDPSGQYVYVTSDKVGGVTTLKLDLATGTLVPTSETTGRVKASSIVLAGTGP